MEVNLYPVDYEQAKEWARRKLEVSPPGKISDRESKALTLMAPVALFLASRSQPFYDFEVLNWCEYLCIERRREENDPDTNATLPLEAANLLAGAICSFGDEPQDDLIKFFDTEIDGPLRRIIEAFEAGSSANRALPAPKESVASHAAALSETPPIDAPQEELLTQLNSLIGLSEAKTAIISQVNAATIDSHRLAEGLSVSNRVRHMAFVGNPGTGKTTVARLVASIYKQAGVVRRGHMVEVSRSELVGQFMGTTGKRTAEAIDAARGGVLLVDEAYSLVTDPGDRFGREALDVLIKGMEDHRHDLVVILTGYRAEMEQFISVNPGLSSRLGATIDFADYSVDELLQILTAMAGERDLDLVEGAEPALRRHLAKARQGLRFGNAREVRALLDAAAAAQAQRLATSRSPDEPLSRSELRQLTLGDLKQTMSSEDAYRPHRVGADDALAEALTSQVMGHDSVVRAIAATVTLTRAGLDVRPQRPNGVFLLSGPAGTGKSQLARALAVELHGSEGALIRLDMGDYSEAGASGRLFAAFPGHWGSEPLTSLVAAKPDSVLLLQDFDKASEDVRDAFGEIFEHGRATGVAGLDADFSNTTIIATTTLGAEAWQNRSNLGFGDGTRTDEQRAAQAVAQVGAALPQELLSRFDHAFALKPLDDETIAAVAQKLVDKYVDVINGQGWSISVDRRVYDHIAGQWAHDGSGGRGLEQALQLLFEPALLDHEPGAYEVTVTDGQVIFQGN